MQSDLLPRQGSRDKRGGESLFWISQGEMFALDV